VLGRDLPTPAFMLLMELFHAELNIIIFKRLGINIIFAGNYSVPDQKRFGTNPYPRICTTKLWIRIPHPTFFLDILLLKFWRITYSLPTLGTFTHQFLTLM
jgi:hypothetical protein